MENENEICSYCNAECFVVYGKCKKCGIELSPPLNE
jgi:hypothetical protein